MKKNKKLLYVLLRENDLRNIDHLKVDCFSLCSILENKSDTRIIYPDPKKTFQKSPEQVLENEIISKVNIILINHKYCIIALFRYKISIYLYLKSYSKADKYKLLVNGNGKFILTICIENIYMHFLKFTNLKINFFKLFSFFFFSKCNFKNILYYIVGNKSYFMPKIYRTKKGI